MKTNILEDILTLGLVLTYYKESGFKRVTAINSCPYSTQYSIQSSKLEDIYTDNFHFPYTISANLDKGSR